MKQWLLKMFNAQDDRNRQSPHRLSRQASSGLPTIVISKGSERNVNNLSNPVSIPIIQHPASLANTWVNNNDIQPYVPHRSVPHCSSRSHPNSTLLNEHNQAATVHCALGQIQQSGTNSHGRATTLGGRPAMQIIYPIQRLSRKNKLHYQSTEIRGLTQPTSGLSYRSEFDNESICGECGQWKLYGSEDLVGFVGDNAPPMSRHRLESSMPVVVNSPKLKHRQLGLERSSYCQGISRLETQIFNKPGTSPNPSYHIDVQKSSTAKLYRGKSTRESSKSTATLTRSWSKCLDSFRFSRNESVKSSKIYRRLSLNANNARPVKQERRRSSLARLLCHDTGDDSGVEDNVSVTESASDETFLKISPSYSPQLTRLTNVLTVDSLDDFKSTFDSDSKKIHSKHGQIKVMFQYINEKTEFHVTILKGINVAPSQKRILGVYVKVCLMPGKLQMKMGDDKHNTPNPVFYDPFTFKVGLDELLDRQLRIKLYNKTGVFSFSESIGKCSVALHQYDLTAVTVIWQNLNTCTRQKVAVDQFGCSPGEGSQIQAKGFRKYLCGLGSKRRRTTKRNSRRCEMLPMS